MLHDTTCPGDTTSTGNTSPTAFRRFSNRPRTFSDSTNGIRLPITGLKRARSSFNRLSPTVISTNRPASSGGLRSASYKFFSSFRHGKTIDELDTTTSKLSSSTSATLVKIDNLSLASLATYSRPSSSTSSPILTHPAIHGNSRPNAPLPSTPGHATRIPLSPIGETIDDLIGCVPISSGLDPTCGVLADLCLHPNVGLSSSSTRSSFFAPADTHDSDTTSHHDATAGSVHASNSWTTTAIDSMQASDKLGKIHVVGMGKSSTGDRLNDRAAMRPTKASDSANPLTPVAATLELGASPTYENITPVTHVNESFYRGQSAALGRHGGPLKHKDSFGGQGSMRIVMEDSAIGRHPSTTVPNLPSQAMYERGPSIPGAFEPSGNGGSRSESPKDGSNLLTAPSTSVGPRAVPGTLGGPISPLSQQVGLAQLGHEVSPPVSAQSGSEEARHRRLFVADSSAGEEETYTDGAQGTSSEISRDAEEPRKVPVRHAVSTKAAVETAPTPSSGAVGASSQIPSVSPAATASATSNLASQRVSSVKPNRATQSRMRPHLPCAPNVTPAPPPAMYWSKVPIHGSVPRRSFRAHTANLADEMLWLFGGCDSKGCFRELWCFDTETMCWSKPKVTGDLPPPRRAHSATMVDKRLFVFAGGDGPYYFNDLYVFDTIALRWTKPTVYGQAPSPRRAHTSNYYNGQLIIFGGGNGVGALNDVFSLDITDLNRLEWKKIECKGKLPIGRGYHTSNLVDGKLIVIGGSDGHMSFNDIHILRLDTRVWYQVKTDEIHNRLGHTATQVGSYLFIVGGHDSQSYTPDILTLNLVNLQWEPRRVCGEKPAGRGYHQAWLRDSRLFVHGGFDGKDIYDDMYFIDLGACAYLPQITSFNVELDDD